MYDTRVLEFLNEQAHLRALDRAVQKSNERTEYFRRMFAEPIFPLAVLANKLSSGPPSLAFIANLLADSEYAAIFQDLVRTYLPKHESDIMSRDLDGRIWSFLHYFSVEHFPLTETLVSDDNSLHSLAVSMPVERMGFCEMDWHGFNDFRPGYILMLALAYCDWNDYEDGGRVPILEAAGEIVGMNLVKQIPDDGFGLEHIEKLCFDKEYMGFLLFARWINNMTGLTQLDINYEYENDIDWEEELVDKLTEEWPSVQAAQDVMGETAAWLENDLRGNFKTLLYYLQGIPDDSPPKEQMAFPLDESGQYIREEVEHGT